MRSRDQNEFGDTERFALALDLGQVPLGWKMEEMTNISCNKLCSIVNKAIFTMDKPMLEVNLQVNTLTNRS